MSGVPNDMEGVAMMPAAGMTLLRVNVKSSLGSNKSSFTTSTILQPESVRPALIVTVSKLLMSAAPNGTKERQGESYNMVLVTVHD